MSQQVLIVGAGIVGLSTAYWLVKAGVDVTVIEQGAIPNPIASSTDHHRLIRYPYGDSVGYTRRMTEGFAAWRALWTDLPGRPERYYAETGMLAVSQEAGDYTDQSRATMQSLGIPFERIDGAAEIAARFPFLDPGNLDYAILSEGGALMANHIMNDLATWLRASGAVLLEHSPVQAIDKDGGAVRLADGRDLSGDLVVVAAGVATGALLAEMELPLTAHRTVIVYADPPEDLAEAWQGAPCWTDLGGATSFWGMPPIAGLPMKLGNGAMRRIDPAVRDRRMAPEEIARMISDYTTRFRGADRFRVRWHQANYWTHAPNDEFLLRERGRVLAVSACSGHGFKFGALSGRDVAEAVTGQRSIDDTIRLMAAQV